MKRRNSSLSYESINVISSLNSSINYGNKKKRKKINER